jgi:cation diffusion facilitator family transporter
MLLPLNFMRDKQHPALIGVKTTILGIVVNFLLFIIKAFAGIAGNSYALIADSIESAGDTLTSVILYFGLKASSQPPDEDHPYGHGKAEPLAGMVIGLALSVASVFIAIQSIENIRTPHPLPKVFTLYILGGVVVLKWFLFRHIDRKGTAIASAAVKGDAIHHLTDVIVSIAVFIGISIALIGGPGYEMADDWAALVASLIILYNGYQIFMPSFSEAMDKAQPAEVVDDIKSIALQVDRVKGIEKCFVRKMGFEYFVDIHIIVDGKLSVTEGHDIAHRVKDAIKQERPNVYDVLTHVEPD